MITTQMAYEAGILAGKYDQPESEYIKWNSDQLNEAYMNGVAYGIEMRLELEKNALNTQWDNADDSDIDQNILLK